MTEFDLSELLDLRKRGHCLGPGQLHRLKAAMAGQNLLPPDKRVEMTQALNAETAQEPRTDVLIVEEVQSTGTEGKPARIETGMWESGLEKEDEPETRSTKPAKRVLTEAQKTARVEAQRLKRQKKKVQRLVSQIKDARTRPGEGG